MTGEDRDTGFRRGINAPSIFDACASGALDAQVVIVISDNSESGALRRAKNNVVRRAHLSAATYPTPESLDQAIRDALSESRADLVVLTEHAKKIGSATLAQYKGKILKSHPFLVPKYD